MEDSIFVNNLICSVDEHAIKSFFGRFGKILELNFQSDTFNDNGKICYIRFSSAEEAAQSVKHANKSTYFGNPMRISLTKYVEKSINKSNGYNRMLSYGRGRGSQVSSPVSIKVCNEVIHLKDLIMPLEKKCATEIIELKDLSNILVRPLQMTEASLPNLYAILGKVNESIDKLITVTNPNINGFYLAKWSDDDKFYRAKVLQKMPDGKYQVCFVDEGTSGDIVTELKVIPDDLIDIPCQFLSCSINCKEIPELIDLVLKESFAAEVSICAMGHVNAMGKYIINIFINDKDIIDLYKTMYKIDPRNEKIPNKSDIKSHPLEEEFSNCLVMKEREDESYLTVVLNESVDINPKLKPLTSFPITNDLLVYKENNGNSHRCLIESYKFDQEQIHYWIHLLDQNRFIDATEKTLMIAPVEDMNFPVAVVKGVIDSDQIDPKLFDGYLTVILSDYDARKDLYVFEFDKESFAPMTELTIGLIKTVIVSHVESGTEFYVQFSEEASKLETIQDCINSKGLEMVYISDANELKVNQVVIAPFQLINYRAVARQIDAVKNSALLYFIDYGNSDWVSIDQIGTVHGTVTRHEPIAHRCKFSVEVKEEYLNDVANLLMDYCGLGDLEVHMKINGLNDGILLVNLTANNKSTFSDMLEFKGFSESNKLSNNDNDVDRNLRLTKRVAELEYRIAKVEERLIRK